MSDESLNSVDLVKHEHPFHCNFFQQLIDIIHEELRLHVGFKIGRETQVIGVDPN